jgi:hypothetical protein
MNIIPYPLQKFHVYRNLAAEIANDDYMVKKLFIVNLEDQFVNKLQSKGVNTLFTIALFPHNGN